jgi:V/A-type H+/Na+-transporting ATPase subunit I
VLVPMTKVRIVGRKAHAEKVLQGLYGLRLLQLVSAREEPTAELSPLPGEGERAAQAEELRLLVAQIDGLLALRGISEEQDARAGPADAATVSRELRAVTPLVAPLVDRIEELRNELAVLPRYIEPLRSLLPLVPELAELDESEIRALQLDAIALVLNTDDESVVGTLREALRAELGDQFVLVSTQVQRDAIGCVIVMPHRATARAQALLGREQVRHLPLPPRYERLSFRDALAAMRRRLAEIPDELARTQQELEGLLGPRVTTWRASREEFLAELERIEAVACAGATSRTFVVAGWVPRASVPQLRSELERAAAGELVVEETPADAEPPVLMRNRTPARPFEFLVRLLDLPRTGSIDPTVLVALILPLMVGMMVGDVAYGVLLLVAALLVRRRYAAGSAVLRDLTRVFVAGALWAIVFGFLFGEALGDAGHRLGLPALWFYRGGADAVERLLLLALGIGVAHVVLGLLLGVWQSARERRREQLLNTIGSLLAVGGVLALAAVATGRAPGGALPPSLAAVAIAVGLALLVSGRGALGLMMGPLELVGTLGNILSYLRLAAVGLASAYLATVSNELALIVPLWIGVVIAAFFHALNLGLAALSPMIQAIRLHYVEFFSKFYEGGGEPFRPFGARAAPET